MCCIREQLEWTSDRLQKIGWRVRGRSGLVKSDGANGDKGDLDLGSRALASGSTDERGGRGEKGGGGAVYAFHARFENDRNMVKGP